MKIRNGFVSNSSSSSFICDICGESYVIYELDPEIGSVCENGHNMCSEHLNGQLNRDDDGQILESFCPICQFKDFAERQIAKYLEKTRGVSRSEVFEKVKLINKRRKKLYDAEYISYVMEKNSLTYDAVLEEVKERFQVYKEYQKFLNSKD